MRTDSEGGSLSWHVNNARVRKRGTESSPPAPMGAARRLPRSRARGLATKITVPERVRPEMREGTHCTHTRAASAAGERRQWRRRERARGGLRVDRPSSGPVDRDTPLGNRGLSFCRAHATERSSGAAAAARQRKARPPARVLGLRTRPSVTATPDRNGTQSDITGFACIRCRTATTTSSSCNNPTT